MGEIDELTEFQTEILKQLISWDYKKQLASAFNLNIVLKGSVSNIHLNLRLLHLRGLVASKNGSWFIREKIIPKLVEAVKDDTPASTEQSLK